MKAPTEPLIQRARDSRTSGAALKAELSTARSKFPRHPLFVFEGADDIGPFSVWISRINNFLEFKSLPGRGKAQVLDLRRRLARDETGLAAAVYFFVDRDFDGLRGQPTDANTYVTRGYSVENELVCAETVRSILVDEMRLTDWDSDAQTAVELFDMARKKVAESLKAANWRLFCRVKLGIHGGFIESQISRYIQIHIDDAPKICDDDLLRQLIPTEREADDAEMGALRAEFERLIPFRDYRGKFWLSWFLGWLQTLAEELHDGEERRFRQCHQNRFNPATMTPRTLAGRSPVPECLQAFVKHISLSIS